MRAFSIQVNGRSLQVKGDGSMPLLWVLRDVLNLTGTKYGCGVGYCGACTIHRGGEPVRACEITLAQAAGQSFTTIEGLSPDGSHPCQRAWVAEDVAQCGYCQPGMIMEAAALLRRSKDPSDADINQAMSTHTCRCGTYSRIRSAIRRAAQEVKA